MKMETAFVPGLEGVIATETAISLLDTEKEKIVIKGYDLIELSKEKDYLDIAHLLLADKLPVQNEKAKLEKKLKENYAIPSAILDVFSLLPQQTHPMDGLRTGISVLADYDVHNDVLSFECYYILYF